MLDLLRDIRLAYIDYWCFARDDRYIRFGFGLEIDSI